jgi:ATP-dependent Lon protease
MIVPLFVGRNKSVKALENAMSENKKIVLISQLNSKVEDPSKSDLFSIGTLASILQLLKLPDGTLKVLVEGQKRVKVEMSKKRSSFLDGKVKELPDHDFEKVNSAKINTIHTIFEDYLNLNKKSNNEIINIIADIKEPSKLIDTIISNLSFSIKDKQEFLELSSLDERANKLINKLQKEVASLEAEKKVRTRVKVQMEKTQREYYLNEQLKAIQKELGSDEDGKGEFEDIAEKISKAKLPKDALEKVQSEFKKLKSMSSMSAEATVVRSYIDWILTLPWNKFSNLKIDLIKAKKNIRR